MSAASFGDSQGFFESFYQDFRVGDETHLFRLWGDDCVRHLFRVVWNRCSLAKRKFLAGSNVLTSVPVEQRQPASSQIDFFKNQIPSSTTITRGISALFSLDLGFSRKEGSIYYLPRVDRRRFGIWIVAHVD